MPPRAPQPSGERGIALLLVLLFMPIVFAIVGELAFDTEVEHRAAVNVKDQAVIEYAIDGEFELALSRLRYDKRQNDVDSEFDGWAAKEDAQRTDGDVVLNHVIADEAGKFNLASLVTGPEPRQALAKERFVRILDLFREETPLDVSLVDAQELTDKILAHLRREAAPGQVPHPKTNPPGVPLLLEEIVFADPKKMPDLLVDQRTRDNRKVAPGLHRYVTAIGGAKVNLNTASLLVLQAFFSEPRDREFAQGMIDRRNGGTEQETGPARRDPEVPQDGAGGNPFTDVNQVSEVEGLTAEVLQRNGIEPANDFDVKSDFFSVRIVGETKATQRIELYVVERVGSDGFRFLLHQERTDPLLLEEGPGI